MSVSTEPRVRTEARFLEWAGRRLFTLQLSPAGTPRGSVLYLPPFNEEMNRCRSHVAATARALAARGWRCWLLDPYGTGESDGGIADATWRHWLDDAREALAALRALGEPVTLWGIRTGGLLAAEIAAADPAAVAGLLLWQPVVDGGLFVTQHLRLKLASQVVQAGAKETTESLRERLRAGEAIEITGYPFTGTMADELAARRLADWPALAQVPVTWIEVVGKPEQALAPASRRVIEGLVAAGGQVRTETVVAPLIWQLQERDQAPALREASVRLMCPETPA
jgi:exosortase A-associated hydrolase 2